MGAKQKGYREGTEGRKVIFSILWYIQHVSGHGAGISIPGKSQEHVKECELGQKSEISLLPLTMLSVYSQGRRSGEQNGQSKVPQLEEGTAGCGPWLSVPRSMLTHHAASPS